MRERLGKICLDTDVVIGYLMKFIMLALFLQVTTLNLAWGQESYNSFHVVGIGKGLNQIREENLLPLVHTGFDTGVSYEFRNIKGNYQDFQLSGTFCLLKTRAEDLSATGNIKLNAIYSYCFGLIGSDAVRYYLGPQAKMAYSVALYSNWDESHLYWADYYSAGLNNILSFRLKNEKNLVFNLSLPLLSFYSRPDAMRLFKADEFSPGAIIESMNSDLKPGFWNTAFFLHFGIEYQFPVFQSKRESIAYSIDFTRIKGNNSNPFKQLIHQVGLRILL